jgi:hypothetical protein
MNNLDNNTDLIQVTAWAGLTVLLIFYFRPPKRKSQADNTKDKRSSLTQGNLNDSSNSTDGSVHDNSFPSVCTVRNSFSSYYYELQR